MPDHYAPRAMIEKLIGFDTVSSKTNLPLIDFVADYLEGYGLKPVRVFDETGEKANLYCTVGNPMQKDGVILSGHTDVVPIEGQEWDTDPFTVVEKDGKLFGRGTCDMKSFSAVALSRVPEMLEKPLRAPIHFALSYDEEVGCTGCLSMIREMAGTLPRQRAVIVGEPTNMRVVNAHKSIAAFRTIVTGHEAHSSNTHKGVNAIQYAVRLIGRLLEMEQEFKDIGDASGRFDPPYTSIHVGTIKGGTAQNIIPRQCSFSWEYRGLPDLDDRIIFDRFQSYAAELEQQMKAVSSDSGIETVRGAYVPGLRPDPESTAETLALSLANQNETHAVAYGTEAGHFQAEDIPTIICGPGSIDQAHQPNEFVSLAQVEACDRFILKLIETMQ